MFVYMILNQENDKIYIGKTLLSGTAYARI